MAISNPQPPARPAKDEWGVYDPEQAGLAALFARLDAPAKPAVSDHPTVAELLLLAERPARRDTK